MWLTECSTLFVAQPVLVVQGVLNTVGELTVQSILNTVSELYSTGVLNTVSELCSAGYNSI